MPFPPLYNTIVSSELVEERTLSEIAQRLGDSLNEQSLGAELINLGLINEWQLSQLLEGRTKFSLGEYRIFDFVGQGGYGQVFLAVHNSFVNSADIEEHFVAVKVLPSAKATPELVARFLREIAMQKELSHPHLVRYIDSGFDGNVYYMTHEFIDAGDLKCFIRDNGRLEPHWASKIGMQIAAAIQYLHENGIVHRDIKPANILLQSDGVAKLADLGFAVKIHTKATQEDETESIFNTSIQEIAAIGIPDQKDEEDAEKKAAVLSVLQEEGLHGKLAGTADYMAPDQIKDLHTPSFAWDMYSFGCTLYHVFTGTVPFPSGSSRQKVAAHLNQNPPDPRMFVQDLSLDIVGLLHEMMEKDAKNRIKSMQSVVDWLRPWTVPQAKESPDVESIAPNAFEAEGVFTEQHWTLLDDTLTGCLLYVLFPVGAACVILLIMRLFFFR